MASRPRSFEPGGISFPSSSEDVGVPPEADKEAVAASLPEAATEDPIPMASEEEKTSISIMFGCGGEVVFVCSLHITPDETMASRLERS